MNNELRSQSGQSPEAARPILGSTVQTASHAKAPSPRSLLPGIPGDIALQAPRQAHPVFQLHVVGKAAPVLTVQGEPGATAQAILSEIRSSTTRLLEHGETSLIDLRFLKSMPEERATLARLLGHGEVRAVVEATDRSEVQETAIPCVWWVRYLNSEDEMVGEIIEVTDIPALLVGDRQAIPYAFETLDASKLPGIG